MARRDGGWIRGSLGLEFKQSRQSSLDAGVRIWNSKYVSRNDLGAEITVSDQPAFNFVAPDVHPVSESFTVPFRKGSHSSYTGAKAQTLKLWTEKQSALLQMIDNGQPLTRNQLALFLHWPLSSVCSILASVRDQVEVVDYETYDWGGGRTTKRERFQIRRG